MLPTVQTGYDSYYELCLKLMRRGGLIAFDNTLWYGRVLEAGEENTFDFAFIDADKVAAERF